MYMHSENMKKNNSVFVIFFLINLILVSSCAVQKHRKVLSFFFDGVPGPDVEQVIKTEDKNIAGQDRRKVVKVRFISTHPDYKTKECTKCHTRDVSNFLRAGKKELCFICHKEEKFEGPYVHGPVAVRACNTCHDPHQSENRKLLLADGKKLCVLCHRTPITGVSLPCKGDNCLECHDPHISDNKFFLKKI